MCIRDKNLKYVDVILKMYWDHLALLPYKNVETANILMLTTREGDAERQKHSNINTQMLHNLWYNEHIIYEFRMEETLPQIFTYEPRPLAKVFPLRTDHALSL